MQARSQKVFIISYMYLAVELIIFLSFIDILVFISGEAGHLSFPIPRGLQFTSRNWMEEIYLLYLVNISYLCIIINPRADKRRARVLIPPGYLHPGKRKH
jgi:hypothetical protein